MRFSHAGSVASLESCCHCFGDGVIANWQDSSSAPSLINTDALIAQPINDDVEIHFWNIHADEIQEHAKVAKQ